MHINQSILKPIFIVLIVTATTLVASFLSPMRAEASWGYVRVWSGKQYYACKYNNTRGRIKVVNTTGSRKTFTISGTTYHVATYGTTSLTVNKSTAFDVDGYKFNFSNSYPAC